MKIQEVITFDTHEVAGGVEIDALLQCTAHVLGNEVNAAKTEAVQMIRRQVFGELEDIIRADLSLFANIETSDRSFQGAVILAFKRLLNKIDNH